MALTVNREVDDTGGNTVVIVEVLAAVMLVGVIDIDAGGKTTLSDPGSRPPALPPLRMPFWFDFTQNVHSGRGQDAGPRGHSLSRTLLGQLSISEQDADATPNGPDFLSC